MAIIPISTYLVGGAVRRPTCLAATLSVDYDWGGCRRGRKERDHARAGFRPVARTSQYFAPQKPGERNMPLARHERKRARAYGGFTFHTTRRCDPGAGPDRPRPDNQCAWPWTPTATDRPPTAAREILPRLLLRHVSQLLSKTDARLLRVGALRGALSPHWASGVARNPWA